MLAETKDDEIKPDKTKDDETKDDDNSDYTIKARKKRLTKLIIQHKKLSEIRNALETDYIYETRSDEKLRLKYLIGKKEKQLDLIELEIKELETQLNIS